MLKNEAISRVGLQSIFCVLKKDACQKAFEEKFNAKFDIQKPKIKRKTFLFSNCFPFQERNTIYKKKLINVLKTI